MGKTLFGWMLAFSSLRFLDRSVRQSTKVLRRLLKKLSSVIKQNFFPCL